MYSDDASSSDESESFQSMASMGRGGSSSSVVSAGSGKSSKAASSKGAAAAARRKKDRYLRDSGHQLPAHPNLGSDFLVVEPPALRFDSIRPDVLYAMTFSVRNATKINQRIRILPPTSPWYALNYIPAASVAPGLDVRAEIECRIPKESLDMAFEDKVTVVMGEYSVDVPLFASKPHALVKFNSNASLGYVPCGQFSSIDVYFENVGNIPAAMTFKQAANSRFKLSSNSLNLNCGERERIVISFEAKEVCTLRELVEVSIQGALHDDILDVSVNVVDQKLSLLSVNNKALMDSIDFGEMFYGQKKTISAILANTGPAPIPYLVCYPDDEKASDAMEPEHDESAYLEKRIVVQPSEGIAPPFSETPVTITFSPLLNIPKSGFALAFNNDNNEPKIVGRKISIDSTETTDKLSIFAQGTVMQPNVTSSHEFLEFGECPQFDRRDIRFTIQNESSVKTTFEFGKSAQFKFTPSKGKLEAKQSLSIIASFLPPQLGSFKQTIYLNIANGLKRLPFRLSGDSEVVGSKRIYTAGTDKLPEHFKTDFKFVDPEEVSRYKHDKQLGQLSIASVSDKISLSGSMSSEMLPSLGSTERDLVYGMNSVSKSVDFGARQSMMDNNSKYNEFLQQSHKMRHEQKREQARQRILARGGADRLNPLGVDLGMARGLREPELVLPPSSDTLWTKNQKGEGENGSKSRLPADENRLIQKKYSSKPITQAEMKDCVSELTQEQQKLVTPSHKVIDYGRVCLNSVAAKNFSVCNDLTHSVLVRISDLEPEFKQSKPEAQVIPQGGIAGFDMLFCSKVIGKYKKTFTWSINGKHTFKVTVLAEVIPLEVLLSTPELIFEFPEDSMEASVTRDLILTNPGNAPAEYLWGNSGAFECKPDRGVIDVGHSAHISVTWKPTAGKRNDEELGLHIPGGLDKVLKVVGLMKEAHAEFEESKVNFHLISVGIPKRVTVHIKNPGEHSAVVYINPCDEKYGITTSVDKLHIPAGHHMPVTITLAPKAPVAYDTLFSASIRGGKSFSIKLIGEAIVPDVTITPQSFNFGLVAVGSDFSLPISITNNSSITASMTLDLTKYPDFKPFWLSSYDLSPQAPGETYYVDDQGNKIDLVVAKGEQRSKSTSNIWTFSILAGRSLHAAIVFKPSQPRQFSFNLPLYMAGCANDNRFKFPVTCESIHSRVEVTMKSIDFGDKVVSRDPMSLSSYFLEFSIKNVDMKQGFAFEIREQKTSVTTYEKNDDKAHKEPVVEVEGLPVFFTSPVRNDIPPGSACPVRVTFMPRVNGFYERQLFLYITGQPDPDRPYMVLYCKGSGVYPRLAFDQQVVTLPTVPLGIMSKASFTIFNMGYTSTTLQYALSPVVPVPVKFTFPDGLELNPSVKSIKVLVSYSADAPVSWSGKLEFYDSDGERFSITLAGCADNCLLTNYPFVSRYADAYGFLGLDNQPARLYKKSVIMDLRNIESKKKELIRKQKMLERQKQAEHKNDGGISPSASPKKSKKKDSKDEEVDEITKLERQSNAITRAFDENGGIDLDRESLPANLDYIDGEVRILLGWMNKFVCRRQFDSSRFPECIIENHGDVVVDCIEQIIGKNIPGIKTASEIEAATATGTANASRGASPAQQQAKVGRVLAKYQAILNVLVRAGALVNHINPIVLLNLDDHLIAQEIELKKTEGYRITASALSEWKEKWNQCWHSNCKIAWLEILFQIIRIYFLNRVSYKEFTHMPGVLITSKEDIAGEADGKKKKKGPNVPPEYTNSNVYTSAEAVLLAWASYHLQKAGNLPDEGATGNKGIGGLFGLNKRVVDPGQEFKDIFGFCQIFHSHVPDMTKLNNPLCGYSTTDKSNRNNVFQFLAKAMDSTRLNFNVNVGDLTSSRSFMLLLLHFYLNLPQFIPKSKIEFKGILGAPLVKVIELRNPSRKAVSYDVSMNGSSDFSAERVNFEIPPESYYEFKIYLNPRFSEQSSGSVTFWGIRDGGVSGTNLVFSLQSTITGRKAVETYTRNVTLYELDQFQLTITNPFDQSFHAPIRMFTEHTSVSVDELIKGSVSKAANRIGGLSKLMRGDEYEIINPRPDSPQREDFEIEKLYIKPIWLSEEMVELPPRGTKTITVQVLPFFIGTYNAQIVLLDPDVGEFCYDIVANIGLPRPSDKFDFTCFISNQGSSSLRSLRIASKNSLFERALNYISENRLTNPAKKTRCRTVLQNLLNISPQDLETGITTFCVESTSPVINFQKLIPFVSEYISMPLVNGRPATVPAKYKKLSRSSLETPNPNEHSSPTSNTTILSLNPSKAGQYFCKVVVFPKDNQNDIRVIDLTANAHIADVKMQLEFIGPCRQQLTQNIPIYNPSEKDWSLTANIIGQAFSGAKTLHVPRKSTVEYVVTFNGPSIGQFDGTLQLRNVDGDTFDYTLTGISEEPLAEDHIKFKCKARSKEHLSVPIFQIPKAVKKEKKEKAKGEKAKLEKEKSESKLDEVPVNQRFAVETDIPYLVGPQFIEVPPDTPFKYNFIVCSPIGGLMSGSLSFTDVDGGAMIWYTIDIDVSIPAPEKTISVEAVVRKAVSIEISLDNPTNEELRFDVTFEGEGLLGDDYFILPPLNKQNDEKYELIYSPLLSGRRKGKVSFLNEKVGVFWYELDLNAIPSDPIVVDPIQSMIGSSGFVVLPIDNPIPGEVSLQVYISNTEHFKVVPDIIKLAPYAQSTFELHFTPSNLNAPEYTDIVFSHPEFGELEYRASGEASLPGVLPVTKVFAPLNDSGSHSIVFKNPFHHPLPVDVSLLENTLPSVGSKKAQVHKEAFSLLMKKSHDLVIAPKTTLHMTVGFNPTRLVEYHSSIQVRAGVHGRSLLWTFPIVGLAEASAPLVLEPMIINSKKSVLRDIEVPLFGINKEDFPANYDFNLSEFSVETNVDEKNLSLVNRSFRAQLVQILEVDNSKHRSHENDENSIVKLVDSQTTQPAAFKLKCRLLFEPLRNFNATVELILVLKNKGRWRLSVDLYATDPEPDDTIVLTAPIGGIDQVSFRLSNRFLGYSTFKAYFSSHSSQYFQITPASGVLAPFGAEGTPFVVSYAPTAYGSRDCATLVISTEDAQWNYQVVGQYPDKTVTGSSSMLSLKRNK